MYDFCSCWKIQNNKEVCLGTKEIDPCSCGGLKSKCDFYAHVREEAVEADTTSVYKTTKERLKKAEKEVIELRNQLKEKEYECIVLRTRLRHMNTI